MKKRILIVLIAVGTMFSVRAQLLPSIDLGVKAGLNFSKLKSDGAYFNSETGAGFLAGAWGRVGFAGIHVQPEIYYTTKNSKVTKENGGSEADAKFSTIDVPILLGTKIGLGPIGGRIQAGPLFSFMVNKDTELSNERFKDNFAAIAGGIGADISKFTIDLRYEHGLGNLSKNSEKQTLNLWTISLGYNFM